MALGDKHSTVLAAPRQYPKRSDKIKCDECAAFEPGRSQDSIRGRCLLKAPSSDYGFPEVPATGGCFEGLQMAPHDKG